MNELAHLRFFDGPSLVIEYHPSFSLLLLFITTRYDTIPNGKFENSFQNVLLITLLYYWKLYYSGYVLHIQYVCNSRRSLKTVIDILKYIVILDGSDELKSMVRRRNKVTFQPREPLTWTDRLSRCLHHNMFQSRLSYY